MKELSLNLIVQRIKTVKPGTVVANDNDVTVVETKEETVVEEPTVTETSENNETKE